MLSGFGICQIFTIICCIISLYKGEEVQCFNYNSKLLGLEQTNEKLSKGILEDHLIHPSPRNIPYNFSVPIGKVDIKGQEKQPQIINDHIFKGRIKNGFFIEAGAYDGEIFSNTLYYETKYNWTGILIEPNPDAFEEMKLKQRKAWLLGSCLSTSDKSDIVEFDASGLLGGIIHEGKKPGQDETNERSFKRFGIPNIVGLEDRFKFKRRTIQVQCFPLFSILQAIGNPTVHYFSLDVEGAELPILQSIPFEKVDIKVLDIEIKLAGKIFPGSHEDITNLMLSKGYDLYGYIGDGIDAIYVKNGYLDELNEL